MNSKIFIYPVLINRSWAQEISHVNGREYIERWKNLFEQEILNQSLKIAMRSVSFASSEAGSYRLKSVCAFPATTMAVGTCLTSRPLASWLLL